MSVPIGFYNDEIHNILFNNLNDDDRLFIKNNNIDIDEMLFNRWGTIVSSLPFNLYEEYTTVSAEKRNIWFQIYINLESHDITKMPELLL